LVVLDKFKIPKVLFFVSKIKQPKKVYLIRTTKLTVGKQQVAGIEL